MHFVRKCDLTEKNESPMKAFINEDKIKLYLSDVGILRALSNLEYNKMYKGVLTENYVACEFYFKFNELFYYNFNKYEIDFLIKIDGNIIPVEVKSGRRLNEYIEKYKPLYSIRLSTKNFEFENNIKSVPLYAIFCIKK